MDVWCEDHFWQNPVKGERNQENIDIDIDPQSKNFLFQELIKKEYKQEDNDTIDDMDNDNHSDKIYWKEWNMEKHKQGDINQDNDHQGGNFLSSLGITVKEIHVHFCKCGKPPRCGKKYVRSGSLINPMEKCCGGTAFECHSETSAEAKFHPGTSVSGKCHSGTSAEAKFHPGTPPKISAKKTTVFKDICDELDEDPGDFLHSEDAPIERKPTNTIKGEPVDKSDIYIDSDYHTSFTQKYTARRGPPTKNVKKASRKQSYDDPDYKPSTALKSWEYTPRRERLTRTKKMGETENTVSLQEEFYHCPQCGKRYVRWGNLINHMEKCCGETAFECYPETSAEAKFHPGTSAADECNPGTSTEAKFRTGTSAADKCRPGTSAEAKFRPGTSAADECRPRKSAKAKFRPGTSAEAKFRPGTSAAAAAVRSISRPAGSYATNLKPIQCPYCLKYFNSGNPIKTHLRTTHNDVPIIPGFRSIQK